jgi:integrase/recombinase XerD
VTTTVAIVAPRTSAEAVSTVGPFGDALGEATAAWLAAKKPTTREAYRRDVQSWIGFCARRGTHVLTARKPDADLFGAWLQDPSGLPDLVIRPLSAASAARRMAAVSSWYRYLVACDVHERNPFEAAERPKVDRDFSATAWLDEAGARRLIEVAETRRSSSRVRDVAMVRLMLQLGIRVTEVVALDLSALGAVRGQRTVVIKGKGGKRVQRALPAAAGEALDQYVAQRAASAGVEPGALSGLLFVTASGRPVDRVEVFRLVRKLAALAGVEHPEGITPHALRHTFATIATERGADLDDLQDAMGHADPRTTRRYQRASRRLERDPAHLVAAALG